MHNERKKLQYKSNPDIKTELSKDNYHLIEPTGSYNEMIKKRIEEAGVKRIRKDSVRFQDGIVTASPEFLASGSDAQVREFFNRALDFYVERFGKENILSAVVHMDEKTPHMHFAFVPITKDGRLSSKELIGGPVGLTKMQDEFFNHMSSFYPELDRGMPKHDTGRQHLTTAEYKKAQDMALSIKDMFEVLSDMNVVNMAASKKHLIREFHELVPQLSNFSDLVEKSRIYQEKTSAWAEQCEHSAFEAKRQVRDIEREAEADEKFYRESVDQFKKRISSLEEELNKMNTVLDALPDYAKEEIAVARHRLEQMNLNMREARTMDRGDAR